MYSLRVHGLIQCILSIVPWFIFHGLEKRLITVIILFQAKMGETTNLSNSLNIGVALTTFVMNLEMMRLMKMVQMQVTYCQTVMSIKLMRMSVMRKPCLRVTMIIKSVQGMSYSMHIYWAFIEWPLYCKVNECCWCVMCKMCSRF